MDKKASKVLHGAISPAEGITLEDLKIHELVERMRVGEIREVILATNPSMEGEATAMYIYRQLQGLPARVTRLAAGCPSGAIWNMPMRSRYSKRSRAGARCKKNL